MSCTLDDCSALEEIRFVENDPVREGLVGHAEDYPWSSARHHVMVEAHSDIVSDCHLSSEIKDWRTYLTDTANETMLYRTWQNLKTGRPAGDEQFVRKLECILGRKLMAMPRGRPRKSR